MNHLEFLFPIKEISKFEKNNLGIAVNIVFSSKKGKICTARRSGFNGQCKKQVNLLMVVDGEERHYTVIKNMSRLLSRLNGKSKRAHNYRMNCLNNFRTTSARVKHYEK